MGKASAPGRTKTRLAPPLSPADAARLNTAFLQDICGNLLAAQGAAPIAPHIAYGPAGSELFFREHLPASIGLIECSLPNFGDCLYRAVSLLLEQGYLAACVLNSDSPTLPTRVLIDAARILAQPGDRVVVGPSTDGGYYLLGLKRPHHALFEGVDWSTEHVFRQTCERARGLQLYVHLLEPWYDVDDARGLARLLTDLRTAADCYAAPHTRQVLEDVLPRLAEPVVRRTTPNAR